MAVPLALTHGEDQKGWRRNQHLVDSLPYIDSLTPAEKRAVDQLIEEEVRCASGKAVHVPAQVATASGCLRLKPALKQRLFLFCTQMRSSSKRPSDYLGDLEPLPESRIAVSGAGS
jgi:pre-mRNA-splicing factor SPF27